MFRKPRLLSLFIIALSLLLAACSQSQHGDSHSGGGLATKGVVQEIEHLVMKMNHSQGAFREGNNDFTLEFLDANKPTDVGAITLYFDMPAMGTMPYMKSEAKLTTTDTPGRYQGAVNLEMGGTWQVHVKYKGAAGEGKTDFSIQTK